ncbi:MAG: RecX family transcriptional regulator [Chloroflexota bacterium]
MSKITAIRIGGGRTKRAAVSLDGRFAFNLAAEVAASENLKTGQELSEGQVEALLKADKFHRCLEAALSYLSYRPQSESEIRQRLKRRGFAGDSIEGALSKLKEQELIDDTAFAHFWKENRDSFNPRSQRLIRLELGRKGIATGTIDQVVDDASDSDNAYRATRRKARSLPLADYPGFRRRLGEYLRRRGFSYDVINHTVSRMWQEREERQQTKGGKVWIQ